MLLFITVFMDIRFLQPVFIAGRDDPGALYTDEFQVMQF